MYPFPLLPEEELPPDPKLVGIARLASKGGSIRQGHLVEYFTLPARSLLNRCSSTRVPFRWTINPYRGCEFACKYCYARYTHEFLELRDNLEFERKIFVKQDVAWLLRQELKQVKRGESIALGTATDPYQPAEKRYQVTRAILEELARHHGLELGIVTKSTLVIRDLDLLGEIAERNWLCVNVTITTLDVNLARLLEPRAPRPDLRLKTVRLLRNAGIRTGVNCAPIVPGITDAPAALDRLVKAAATAGAQNLWGNPVFLKPCSASVFLPFLEEHFPHLVEDYRRRFAKNGFVNKAYANRIAGLIAGLKKKHGIATGEHHRKPDRRVLPEVEQMRLFA